MNSEWDRLRQVIKESYEKLQKLPKGPHNHEALKQEMLKHPQLSFQCPLCGKDP